MVAAVASAIAIPAAAMRVAAPSAIGSAVSVAAFAPVVAPASESLRAETTAGPTPAPAAGAAPRQRQLATGTDASPRTVSTAEYSGVYGAPLIAGCAWATWVAGCGNLTVYGNGSSFDDVGCGSPNYCAFGPEFQCTELVQRYAHYAFGEPDTWDGAGGGAAFQFWADAPLLPVPLAQLPSGGGVLPQAGDIIVFGPGWIGSYWDADGHVAVVNGVNIAAGTVTVVEENGSPSGTSTLSLRGTTVTGNGYTPTIGWLRYVGSSSATRLVAAAGVVGSPHAVSLSPGYSAIFWRGTDSRLHALFDNQGAVSQLWGGLQPANMASDPSPVVLPGGVVDVLWRGSNGSLWEAASSERFAATDLDIGGVASVPNAVASADGTVVVAWTGVDGTAWTTSLSKFAMILPHSLGGAPVASQPFPVAWSPTGTAVVWRGTDSNLWWDVNAGVGWQGAQNVASGPLSSEPQVISPQPGSLDVFWAGGDTRTHEFAYSLTGGTWSGVISGTGMTGTPEPVATGFGSVSLFVADSAGDLVLQTYYPSIGWLTPARLTGGVAAGPTAAMGSFAGSTSVFWVGTDGGIWSAVTW